MESDTRWQDWSLTLGFPVMGINMDGSDGTDFDDTDGNDGTGGTDGAGADGTDRYTATDERKNRR